ncbi:hypothetical protein [Nocardia sp. alder85J]|uniref:hypothetical protein n=1 Tax=Nocardia sp. alder85J TaxID=2862949 RepID=UPI001CD294DF|nr:hypothetical protein [Nocardia sp. alder85J]MCX4095330.1 hypothetical protein [Nocardia sp. alder85J]
MPTDHASAETRVLDLLAPGGLLDVEQIARQAHLTGRAARTAVTTLARRGWIASPKGAARWNITTLGLKAVR